MNRIQTLMTAVLLLCLLFFPTSCRKVVIDSEEKDYFLNCQQIGIYPEGLPLFTYNEARHQMCTNPSRGVFRIQTNAQDTCLNISLKDNPSREGDRTTAEMNYIYSNDRIENLIQFECSKISGKKLWLWDGLSKTGIIILKP